MDFNTIDKIIDAFRKRPKRTVLILCIMALIVLSAVFLKSYFGELGKKVASDSGAKEKAEPGIQIGKIETSDQSQVFVGSKVSISGVSPKVIERLLKNLDEKDVALQDREAKLQELAQKYKKLEERLASRSAEDEFAAQAKEKLDKGDLEGAEELLVKSLEKNLKIIAEKKKAAASDAFELGSLKELQLDYHSAKKYYEQAVQIEPDNTEYLNNFGLILHELGEYKDAIKNHEKALAINLKFYGDQHPNAATRYNNLGAAWKELGKYQKAIDYFEKALAIDLKVYGDQHPNVATLYNNLGLTWGSLGKYQKAIDYFEKALFIFTSLFGNNHPYTKTVKSNLESLKKDLTSSKNQ